MAWIELHQSLPTHRKTIEAAAELDVPPVQMVGHLCCLWLWSLDNAEDGVLVTSRARNALRNSTIASASHWTGDPDAYVAALLAVGYLDQNDEALRIHDWDDYAGRLLSARKANRDRQRRHRQKQKTTTNDDPTDNDNVTVTSPSRNGATVPYRTEPISSSSSQAPLSELIQKHLGVVGPEQYRMCKELADEFGVDMLAEAMRIARERGKAHAGYVAGIANQWRQHGIRNMGELRGSNGKPKYDTTLDDVFAELEEA